LLLRLIVGAVFIQAGWGKFMHFDSTVGYFGSIGIPFPAINVLLAAGTELVGGVLLILGFMTQLIALPLAFVMFIALVTAHLHDFSSIVGLFELKPFIYLVIFLLLSATGAGKRSLDNKCCSTNKK